MSHLTPEGVVITRSGEVRLRTRNRMSPIFGTVLRDPKNPRRWIARNRKGLPIGTRTSTRAEAVAQLTEYTDEVVLSTVPVEDHVAVNTGPVAVVPDLTPQRARSALQHFAEIGVGVLALGTTALAAWGILLIS